MLYNNNIKTIIFKVFKILSIIKDVLTVENTLQ